MHAKKKRMTLVHSKTKPSNQACREDRGNDIFSNVEVKTQIHELNPK
jgi:hypothetical protein